MESRCPTILLNKVDLPTLGRPTMATIGFAMFSPILSKKRETRLCFFSYPMFQKACPAPVYRCSQEPS